MKYMTIITLFAGMTASCLSMQKSEEASHAVSPVLAEKISHVVGEVLFGPNDRFLEIIEQVFGETNKEQPKKLVLSPEDMQRKHNRLERSQSLQTVWLLTNG